MNARVRKFAQYSIWKPVKIIKSEVKMFADNYMRLFAFWIVDREEEK